MTEAVWVSWIVLNSTRGGTKGMGVRKRMFFLSTEIGPYGTQRTKGIVKVGGGA